MTVFGQQFTAATGQQLSVTNRNVFLSLQEGCESTLVCVIISDDPPSYLWSCADSAL